MNIQEALNRAYSELESEEPQVDAQYLLSFVLDKDFTWLKTWSDRNLTEKQILQFEKLIVRRNQGEPVAYITGEKHFWTLTLKSNSSTLIPRAETEILVEQALLFLEKYPAVKVLDLGTGTGAIGLAIASERSKDLVYACDLEGDAVELAKLNAKNNNIDNIEIFQSDWFSRVEVTDFDLIVANPPYIVKDDPHLTQGDLIFEPDSALVSGENGFADIKKIIRQATGYLNKQGVLMLEHGFEQGEQVRELLAAYGYTQVKTIQDLSKLDRVTMGVVAC